MATTNKPIHYGDFAGICQLCFKDGQRFGTLVDANGHTWLICQSCIIAVWEAKQPFMRDDILHQDTGIDDDIEEIINRLRRIRRGDSGISND